MRPVGEDAEKQALLGIIQNLREDRARLVSWAGETIEQLNALTRQTAGVRELAGDLVRSSSRQGIERQRAEERLYLEGRQAHGTFAEICARQRPEWKYLEFSNEPALRSGGFGRGERGLGGFGYQWEDWVRQSAHWDAIKTAATELVAAARSLHTQMEDEREAAQRALAQMDSTVSRARGWSATYFALERPARAFARASAAPLVVFVFIAIAGIWLSPRPAAGWIVVAILFAVIAGSVYAVKRHGYRANGVAPLAAGSALALFTAAYLACRLMEPSSVQLTSKATSPIGSIAEAAFTSLTVGLTGGTIGIELHGAARIVAFIQILVSLTAVAAGLAWAWDRLLKHTRREDAGLTFEQ
jgi:hypothetical protein